MAKPPSGGFFVPLRFPFKCLKKSLLKFLYFSNSVTFAIPKEKKG